MRRETLLLLSLFPILASAELAADPLAGASGPEEDVELVEVPFTSDDWSFAGSEVVEYLGRRALRGAASLKGVVLENGIVEVDVAVTGERCFPAVNLRRVSASMFEDFYIRPHSPGKSDAVQYAPTFNGQAEWQLCNGEGFTAAVPIPWNEWIPLRVEISGRQARVFVGDLEQPALRVHDLKHEPTSGALMLVAPPGGQVHWSNFRFAECDDLAFPPAPPVVLPEGTITDWEISQPLPIGRVDLERHPETQDLGELRWREVFCEPNGLVDVSRLYRRNPRTPEVVVAKAMILAEEAGRKKLVFGYSDEISIFFGGEILFTGNSAFRSRSPSFLGAISWHDAVFLDLEEGENELLLLVAEDFGGWGFQARLTEIGAPAIRIDPSLSEAWLTPSIFGAPESVTFDPERELLYVSNYYLTPAGGTEFISQVGLDGSMVKGRWITGLDHPTGITIHDGRVFFVERATLTEADLESGEILARHSIPDPGFPNDLCFDEEGNAYVSDGQQGRIYRFAGETVEIWLDGVPGFQPNGLFARGGELFAGDSGSGSVVAIDLENRTLRQVAFLEHGSIVDGLWVAEDGGVLTSDYNGRLYRFDPDGGRTVLLDTTRARHNLADLTYLPEQGLLVIPTLVGGHLRAYAYDW